MTVTSWGNRGEFFVKSLLGCISVKSLVKVAYAVPIPAGITTY